MDGTNEKKIIHPSFLPFAVLLCL